MNRISISKIRAGVVALLVLTACLSCFPAGATARPAQQQPSPQGDKKPPKKKLQAGANFKQYAGRDASNRLIAGGATRNLTDEAEKQNQIGSQSYDAGKYEEAVAAFLKVAELKPESAVAHYNLGVAYEAAGRGDDALASYEKAVALTTKTELLAVAHYNMANVYAAADQPEDAIASYKKVIELLPKEAVAHYNLGLAHAAAGQTREAVEAFKQAVRLKPGYAEAHYNLGVAYVELGDRPAAQAELKSLQELKSELAERLKTLSN